MEKNIFSIQNQVEKKFISNLIDQQNIFIIEGLKRKGFEFPDKNELKKFIISNCRVENNLSLQKKMYFVNDIPFLLNTYSVVVSKGYTMAVSQGQYTYL